MRLAVPKAYVVLRGGTIPTREVALDILRFCGGRLAPYKRIRGIEFAPLPKSISGKIRRVELRANETGQRDVDSRGPDEYGYEDFPELRGEAAPG